jgi:alkylhydroperoxidase family enzyme
MEPRVSYAHLAPAPVKLERELGALVHGGALETSLLELVLTRTLQLNGCAYGFDAREWAALSMAIIAANSWNRMAVAFSPLPGSYQRSAEDASRARDIGVA